MSNWRSWADINRTHVSERERQQQIFDGFVMADYAIAHLIVEMRKIGLPGLADITPPYKSGVQTYKGWQYSSSVSAKGKSDNKDRYDLTISENGEFWSIGLGATIAVRMLQGNSFVFADTEWNMVTLDDQTTERTCRLFGPMLPAFQLLMVEMLRLYGLPMPADQQPVR